MNGIILYLDKSGKARQTACWLVERTGFDLLNLALQPQPDLSAYDIVILGSGLYKQKLHLAPWLQQHWVELFDREILLYFVSAQTCSEAQKEEVLRLNLPAHIATQIQTFTLSSQTLACQLKQLAQEPLPQEPQVSTATIEEETKTEAAESAPKTLWPLLTQVQAMAQKWVRMDLDNAIPI